MNERVLLMIKTFKIHQCYKLIISLTFIYVLLIYPDLAITASKDGLYLSAVNVLPAIFPFMVISKYLMYSGIAAKISEKTDFIFKKLFNFPRGGSFPFIIGIISGYPIGAYTLGSLTKSKTISRENASHMIGFCNNASPVFIIGTIGICILNNERLGYFLYLVHIISAIITALLKRTSYVPQLSKQSNGNKTPFAFTKSVTDSCIACLCVTGYIMFFCVISEIICKLLPLGNFSRGIICSLAEISSGIKYLASLNISHQLKLALISFFLGFSGLSVFFQASAGTEDTGIDMNEYIKTKIIFGIVAFVITYIFSSIII